MARREDQLQQQNQQQEGSALGTAFKVGAIVAAGALGINYRRQIGSGLRNVGDFTGTLGASAASKVARSQKLRGAFEDVSTFTRAMAFAADSRSAVSHIKNRGRFESRFKESLDYSLEARARGRKDRINAEELSGLEDIQKMRLARNRLSEEVFDAHRFNRVIGELTQKMPKEIEAGLDGMLATSRDSLFRKPSPDKVTAFAKAMQENTELSHSMKITGDAQRKKFEDTLFETLDRYKDRRSDGWTQNPEARKELLTVERSMRKELYNSTIKNGIKKDKPEGPVEKFMAQGGWSRATFEDLTNHKRGNLIQDNGSKVPRRNSTSGTDSGHNNAHLSSKAKRLAKQDPRFLDMVADDHLWTNQAGDFLDTRWMAKAGLEGMDTFRQTVQVPFLRFNPLDLMHFTTWQGTREAPKTAFKSIGTVDPGLHGSVKEFQHPLANNQDARVGVLGSNYMNTPDGKVFDLTTGEVAKQGVYQASARYGMMPRAMSSMANLHREDLSPRKGVLGKLADIFDLGKQESDSVYVRMKSTVTKFNDYQWGPNIRQGMHKWQQEAAEGLPLEQRTGLSPESGFKLINSQLSTKSQELSYDSVNYINSKVKDAYGDIDIDLMRLNTQDEVMGALGRIHQALSTKNSRVARTQNDLVNRDVGIEKQIDSTWKSYSKDKYRFLAGKRILPNNAPYMPEFLNALDMHEVDLVEKVDDVRRLIHQHAMKQLNYATGGDKGITTGGLIKDGIREGVLKKDNLTEARNLEIGSTMRKYWDDVYENPERREGALNEFTQKVLDDNDPLAYGIQGAMEDLNPKWAMGPGSEPPQYFGLTDTISMNQGRGYKHALEQYNRQTEAGRRPTDALLSSVSSVIKQPFAGGRNTGDVTTATLPFYYLAERLDNAVAQVGLGLSQKNRGSMQSILTNQMGRRIVMPYVGYQQAVWLDGMTGDFFSDQAAETYANMHEDLGWAKEVTGLNDIGRQWSRVFSGSDQLTESPLGRAFNFASLGLFDHKSGEEVREFYESGEVAVRKGRYWGIGSNTPFTGGKVDRYVPNWYRRIKSDYQFSENAKGSESEYFANHWMPTLTNPLAPIRHFVTDPYHYEKKHEESRPYPVTGGFAELEVIPIVGPALNNSVGRILKPRREHPDLEKAHRAYLEEINNNINDQYAMAGEGGMLQGMPAGGFNVTQGALEGEGTGGMAGVTPEQYQMMIGGNAGGATGAARGQLTAINAMYSDIGGPALGATGKSVRSVTALEDLRDPDVVADLRDIGTMHSASGTLRDSLYSVSEMAGIYGFSTKSLAGWEESGRGMTLEQSTRMNSYARGFWDMELGGLGGQVSEIGRRYNPRDPNKNYWNPIKNTMEDWLPGPEYFTDFKHGDPYVKVANGEMRLPGESYEKLYDLHPDALSEATGSNYGTFDRFRILSDIAPYSENYKFYRKMVSKMNQTGMLDEDVKAEYATIRDQVSERKKKHRFYERRFANSDVNEEFVTVTRMLDATTFITKEYGKNNPIKMAGVGVKSDDTETQQWLEQYLKAGERVKVALDADPLFRVRDDMFNTMRAVVYANKNQEGMPFYATSEGQNLNFMLANRKTGGFFGIGGERSVTTKDDGSATATQALFSKDMITIGKMWETMTHDFLPNIPIVGTIADKFLQVRSPLEMYKRNEVYGKAWRSWNEPIDGWIQPMIETIASKHPVVGAAQGAGIGWLFSKKTPSGTAKYMGTRIGAIIGGGVSAYRVFNEQFNEAVGNDKGWLPERRVKEREINEYYDRLKYVKFRGLYERAAQEAKRREGVDIDELIAEHEARGGENKGMRNTLNSMKKQLSLSKKLGYGDQEAVQSQLDTIRGDLKEIELDRPSQELGKYSLLALRYKEEFESTLYGADVHGDMTKIFRALPSKDREFFTEFMKAAPKDRQKILDLVPEDQRRFYQAKWGLDVDKQESNQSYFTRKHLPDEKWEGWKADTSLENYKIKAVKNEALEMTEFNYWGDDVQRAEESGAQRLPMNNLSSSLDVMRLEKALRGAGLKDVSVSMNASKREGENQIEVAMDYVKDRSGEIVRELNNNMGGIFG